MSAQSSSGIKNLFARQTWHWFLGVYKSLLEMTPGYAFLCVALYIASQFALLFALLLPWKLLLVLSSDAFPRTLPAFLKTYETRELVLILSVSALVALLLHLACEIGISHVCRSGAQTVLAEHNKTGLFNSHREQAALLYRRLLRSLAALVCCAVIVVWLAFAYPLLLLALSLYLCFGLVVAFNWDRMPFLSAQRRPPAELVGKAWWGGGFLYVVGWVIADYWKGDIPGLTTIFISLLLVRQALIFCAQIFQNLGLLDSQRSKVDALFLAEVPWVPTTQNHDSFQTLLEPEKRLAWVRDVLDGHTDRGGGELEIRCRPAESGKIIYVSAAEDNGDEERAFLVKLYHRSHGALAEHEREILQVASECWPAPRLLESRAVEDHTCLVFGWSADMRWLTGQERRSWLFKLREQLFKCELPEPLIGRYDRSHPCLSRRLHAIDWAFLRAFSPSKRIAGLCDILQARWLDIMKELDALPRHLVLPALDERMMGAAGEAAPIICNWTRWRWEPVGAGWRWRRWRPEQLCDVLVNASGARAELRGVSVMQTYRAALLFELERLWTAGNFAAALEILEPICESVCPLETNKKPRVRHQV